MFKIIIICVSLFMVFNFVAMERYTKAKTIPVELKSRIMLFFIVKLSENESSLENILEAIAFKIKYDNELVDIFQNDLIFTENLIEILHNKFKDKNDKKLHYVYIAIKINTKASKAILRYNYEQYPALFTVFIILILDKPILCDWALELLEFAKNNFVSSDVIEIVTYQGEYERTALMNAVFSIDLKLVELILNLATEYLTEREKIKLININTKFGESALINAYLNSAKDVKRKDVSKIINLLEENGAEDVNAFDLITTRMQKNVSELTKNYLGNL